MKGQVTSFEITNGTLKSLSVFKSTKGHCAIRDLTPTAIFKQPVYWFETLMPPFSMVWYRVSHAVKVIENQDNLFLHHHHDHYELDVVADVASFQQIFARSFVRLPFSFPLWRSFIIYSLLTRSCPPIVSQRSLHNARAGMVEYIHGPHIVHYVRTYSTCHKWEGGVAKLYLGMIKSFWAFSIHSVICRSCQPTFPHLALDGYAFATWGRLRFFHQGETKTFWTLRGIELGHLW